MSEWMNGWKRTSICHDLFAEEYICYDGLQALSAQVKH